MEKFSSRTVTFLHILVLAAAVIGVKAVDPSQKHSVVKADTTITIPPEDTTQCAVPQNLVAISSPNIGRAEFYSCMSPTLRKDMRRLDVIVSGWDSKDLATIGVAPTQAEAARLQRKYGKRFIGREGSEYKAYLRVYNGLIKPGK